LRRRHDRCRPRRMAHRHPWQTWGYHAERLRGWDQTDRRRKRGLLFLRFVGVFGVMSLLVAGGIGAVAFVLSRVLGGGYHTGRLVWMTGFGLALFLPFKTINELVLNSPAIPRLHNLSLSPKKLINHCFLNRFSFSNSQSSLLSPIWWIFRLRLKTFPVIPRNGMQYLKRLV